MVPLSERFEMRLDENTLVQVDEWRSSQADVPSRSEAMRRLIERGLERTTSENVTISDGERLLLVMMNDLYRRLEIEEPEIDPEVVNEMLFRGHNWAFKWKYPGIFHGHTDTPEDLRFTLDVMEMWDALERGYERLSKKDKAALVEEAGADGERLRFFGFDGNKESSLLSIAIFLVKDMDRFSRFAGRDLNSHMPTLSIHTRMLNAYRPIRSKFVGGELSASQIQEILKVRRPAGK